MDQFLKFIKIVCDRPSMFVGSPDLHLLGLYLSGYENALLELQILEKKFSLEAFTNWLKDETGEGGDWWTVVLLKMYGSDQVAISELPKKYSEFVNHTIHGEIIAK